MLLGIPITAQFQRSHTVMVHLPNEIIHQIICEYIESGGHCSLKGLSTISRDWQIVVEQYRWRRLRITPREIGCFRSAFRGKLRRRRALQAVSIRFEGYFARKKSKEEPDRECEGDADEESSEDSHCGLWCEVCPKGECARDKTTFTGDGAFQATGNDSDSPRIRLAAAQDEHARFFREVQVIWNELASWEDDLRVTCIWLDVVGSSVYEFVGPEVSSGNFPNDSTLLEFSGLPKLPLLQSVKELHFHEEFEHHIDLWPTIVTCRIASSLPRLECLDTVDIDYGTSWPVARRSLRHG